MRVIAGLWRWRRNPLCRTTDLLEAWVSLAALLLVAVTAPVIGVVTGLICENALQRAVRQQHQQRHQVPATVVRTVAQPPLDTDPETASARDLRRMVFATWKAPDGTVHSGEVTSGLRDPQRGDRLTVWTDRHGTVVPRPLDAATATTHATLAGIGAAAVCVALLDGGRRLIVWRMVCRRYEHWERAWEKAGPDWGRAGAGS